MDKNNQTLYNLATTLGFVYQPFYRLIKSRHTPNMSSLAMIATHLDCTIAELLDDRVFVDITVYKTFTDILDVEHQTTARIYIDYNSYLPYIKETLYAVKDNDSRDITHLHVFIKEKEINTDGKFIIHHNNEFSVVEVLNTSSTYITINSSDQELKIPKNEFTTLGRFIANSITYDQKSIFFQRTI